MIYVDDNNEPPQHILDDAKVFFETYFVASDDAEADNINPMFTGLKIRPNT